MTHIEQVIGEFCETIDSLFEDTSKEKQREYFHIAGHTFLMEFEDLRMKEYFVWQMKLFLAKEAEPYGTIKIKTDRRAGELARLKTKAGEFPRIVKTSYGTTALHVFGCGKRIGELVFAWCGEKRIGWVLIEPDQLEKFYQLSFMLTPLFSKMAPDMGMALIHGAGVGIQGKGVILSGLSGAGKSSLAAACLMSGMQYVSDDTLFLDRTDCKAYPVCSTIHLAPKILEIFHEITGQEFLTRNGRGEKRHLDISFMEDQFVQGLEMKALIGLKIEDGAEFGIRPVSWEQAAVPLVYSSVHLLGEAQNAEAVRNIVACLRKLPAYEFSMSGNLRYNAEYLKNFITNTII